jgi:hypothetical protein
VRKGGAAPGEKEKRTERPSRDDLKVAMTDHAESRQTCTDMAVKRCERNGRDDPSGWAMQSMFAKSCFYYFRNVSTFASLVRHVSPSAGRKSVNAVEGKAHSSLVTFNDWKIGN